jgi:hypothetical protein
MWELHAEYGRDVIIFVDKDYSLYPPLDSVVMFLWGGLEGWMALRSQNNIRTCCHLCFTSHSLESIHSNLGVWSIGLSQSAISQRSF